MGPLATEVLFHMTVFLVMMEKGQKQRNGREKGSVPRWLAKKLQEELSSPSQKASVYPTAQ